MASLKGYGRRRPALLRVHTEDVVGGAAGMEVLYAGAAPGQVAGLIQVNVRIPQAAISGTPAVRIAFDGASGFELTQEQAYLAVK